MNYSDAFYILWGFLKKLKNYSTFVLDLKFFTVDIYPMLTILYRSIQNKPSGVQHTYVCTERIFDSWPFIQSIIQYML